MAENHVGDTGTVFKATIKDESGVVIDVSAATVLLMKFKRPNGTVMEKTALLLNGGTDGKIYYVTLQTDLSVKGVWTVQGYVEVDDGAWHSDKHVFNVDDNF